MNKLLQKIAYAVMFFMTFGISSAYAIPSFARQTGLECTQCHTVFPELTETGRQFKLHGYTMTGGSSYKSPLDNLAAMVILTDTKASAQVNDPSKTNIITPDQISLFYGGKIYENLGAFVQVTYDGTGIVGGVKNGGTEKTNDVAHHFGTDNTDIRYVKDFKIQDHDIVIGATLNNNPTVQDIYNSTPAWGYPYWTTSAASQSPANSTQVEGALGGIVRGLGVYTMIDDLLYLEATGYQSNRGGGLLSPLSYNDWYGQTADVHGTSVYTRAALQKTVGDHFFMLGGYTFNTEVVSDITANNQYNKFADRAIDAQYNYTNGSHIVTIMADKIWEKQTYLDGSSANPNDTLTTSKAKISYYYDQKYGVTAGIFSTSGSADAKLYGTNSTLTPDASGKMIELHYLPTQKVRISLAYTMFDKFNGAKDNYDGAGTNASKQDNLFLSAIIMF